MDASRFWKVVSNYNNATAVYQIGILMLLAVSIVLASKQRIVWLPKCIYGLISLFLAFVFFLGFGSEPIQYFFAFPLYLILGLTFIYEAIKYREEVFIKFTKIQWGLVSITALYPLVSIMQGKTFPEMSLYIMPCPVVCIGLVIWLSYNRKNIVSLVLITMWGLTGVKAFFFNAYEDIILLIVGIYALFLLVNEVKRRKSISLSVNN